MRFPIGGVRTPLSPTSCPPSPQSYVIIPNQRDREGLDGYVVGEKLGEVGKEVVRCG